MKKYILLFVFSYAYSQAPNQMVSFTQAQSLGFSLNPGQNHVSSNQCMTKSQALSKYNLDQSAMSSYASNQLVPRSAWVFSVTYTYVYWWTSYCFGGTLYLLLGSDGKIYSVDDNLYTGYAYEYIGPGDIDHYQWIERNISNGVVLSVYTIISSCAPY
jgi:uncharacterized membrane protein YjdF